MTHLTDLRWHTCTQDDPWTLETGKRGLHPDAKQDGPQVQGYPCGDVIQMTCPHCGVSWEEELPQ